VVSSMTGVPCDGDRLLRGQGLAGLAGGLLGLSPAAGSVASTAVALTAGGRGTLSRVASALGLLLALAIGVVLLQQMAMAAVAGIFLVVARDLVDPWTGQTLSRVLRGRNPGPGAAATVGVLALVATISIGVSLVAGVLAGSLAAVLLFVRGQLRPPVRRVLRGDQLPSRTLRLPAVAAKLRVLARRIVCVELDGALFFGTADAAARAIAQAAVEADHVVLDCRRVREIDASGARVLLQLASSLRARDCRLVLASVAPAGRQALHLLDTRGLLPETAFLADADRALAHAEDAALAAAGVGQDGDGAVLPLAQTLWGQGLDADAVARLESSLEQLDVPAGTAVFRGGEVSDAMYVVLAGQVAIVLPGRADGMLRTHAQRLVSFAPGAFFGEAGVLRGEPRSADAVVERDARLARLDAAELSRLATEFPALHVHLLRAMALHLADRLGALTLAWQALDDAPAAGPAPEATPVETIAQADDQRW
jgi:sulfate permease, SulP family